MTARATWRNPRKTESGADPDGRRLLVDWVARIVAGGLTVDGRTVTVG